MNDGPRISLRLCDAWGARVKERRLRFGLTQDRLAELAGVTQQTVSNIEAGAHLPRDDVKINLARALGTTPGELFPWPSMQELSA